MFNKFYIHTDGGARGNPGPAGIGGISEDEQGKIILKKSKFLGTKTNNQAEYEALVLAFKEAKKLKAKNLEIFSDSELLVGQMSSGWKVRSNNVKSLHIKARELLDNFDSVVFRGVPREENKGADKLVNEAIDNKIKN